MKKVLSIVALLTIVSLVGVAQEKPMRIGLKFGMPNIAGLNLEYATSALNARLAPTADLSYFSMKFGEAKASFSYIELGANYYLRKEGKGPYAHLSYGRVGFKGTYEDIILGEGEGKIGINLVNFKLGAKWGNAFYFRPEIGYALAMGNADIDVEYPNGTTKIESAPGVLSGGPLFNLGFGVAF